MRPTPAIRVFHATSRRLAIVILAATAVACSSGADEGSGASPSAGTATSPTPSAPPAAAASAVDALAVETLEANAQQAVADNRLYAPEGNNAIEFYLAQRTRAAQGGDSAEAALIELQPYAMMAAEQAIAGDDLVEAERLVALMVRIDPSAPSLARLRDDIAARRQARAEAEAAALAAAAAEVDAAADTSTDTDTDAQRTAGTATTASTPAPRPLARTATPARAAAPSPGAAAAERRTDGVDTRRAAAATASTAATAPARKADAPTTPAAPRGTAAAEPGPLVPVSTPFPPFPSEAIARGRSMGSVTVRFTVRANGRVADLRVVEARPEGLFERTVTETLADWRFEPTGRDQTQTRTFNFRN
jgi:protein TonB